jgi:glucokinase
MLAIEEKRMGVSIGALVTEHISVGLVADNQIVGPVRRYPAQLDVEDALDGMPAEEIAQRIGHEIEEACDGQSLTAIGVGMPGIILNGMIEDSPNLKQTKGLNLAGYLSNQLQQKGIHAPIYILNDADAIAAGIAASRDQLDRLVRCWFVGLGVGWGRYPHANGFGEGGHSVVSLDPKENHCGCGGVGHLEGIMGHRAMRLRFLDLEPDEVFAEAAAGDARCQEFVRLWHRALAAATATSVHLDGPGKFYVSGTQAPHLQVGLVSQYLREMVQLTPLQGSTFEVIEADESLAIIGAAISAVQFAAPIAVSV